MTGDDGAAQVAPDVPALVRRRVRWADVVSDRVVAGVHVVVVAADIDRRGIVHLAVGVERRADGNVRIVGAPALVGGPVLDDAEVDPDARRAGVADAALSEVCRRALDNYLAGNARNLAADLSASARVSLPDLSLRLERMSDLRWSVADRGVVAAVEATDRDGVRYRLRYALDVVRVEDRWEISAVATDPTA
jgi:GNAT superfamily N-acetyltransferase